MHIATIFIALFFILNLFLSFTVIFLERKNPATTWAWVLVLTLVPGIGFFLYLLFSQNLTRKKIYKFNSYEQKIFSYFLEEQKKLVKKGDFSYNDSNIEYYDNIIRLHLEKGHSFFSQDNQVEIFTDGHSKFKALFSEIEKAKDHIHLMYYIINGDELGDHLLKLLIKKAKQGIEVRLMYDAIGGRTVKKSLIRELQECGGKVAPFFPSKILFINFKVNFRNHRKLVVIDGNVGFLGGYNVGNEYIGKNKKLGYWRDTHLKIIGSAVLEIQYRFMLDWRSANKEKINYLPKYYPISKSDGRCGLQVVASGPDTSNEEIKIGYIKMINSARKSIYLQTPYFVPDESILEALKIASFSGVDVKIMIPNKPDHPFVYWATYWYAGELIQSGIKFYTYNNGFLHAKTLVVDGIISSVGSSNFDIRSFKLNFELNAFIYDTHFSNFLRKVFEEDLKHCDELTKEVYKKRSLKIKFKESISRLLSPLL